MVTLVNGYRVSSGSSADRPPAYSIVIPAYNEEDYLPETLAAVHRAMTRIRAPGEMVVVDNNSTDATAAVAREAGATVVFEPVNQIARARNTGARHAGGFYLVFVDADTLIPEGLLASALHRMAHGPAGGGGAVLAPDRPQYTAARTAVRFWNRLSRFLLVAAGGFIFCRRDGFQAIGGFDERMYAAEEVRFSLSYRAWARKRGMTFEILDRFPAVTSVRKLDWFSPGRLAVMWLALAVFPPGFRWRRLCAYWYRRPE